MPLSQSNLRGALLSLAAFALYATHDVVVKFLGGSYAPFQLIFFAGLLSFPLVTILLMSDKTDGNLIPKHPWWTAIRTLCAVLTGLGGFYAFSVLPLAQCYAIFFAMPLLITLLAIPILGEKVGIRRGLAVLVGLIGVIIVLRPGDLDLNLGHLAALSAATTGALAAVIVRKIGSDERSVVLMLYPMMANFLIMGAILPFVYFPMPVFHFGMLALMACLGLAGGLLSIAAYKTAPAIIVAPMQYSQILWAMFYGWLFFGEGIDANTAAGIAVIIASGVYIVLREQTPRVSGHTPVLETKSRFETPIFPRISLMSRLFDRRRQAE